MGFFSTWSSLLSFTPSAMSQPQKSMWKPLNLYSTIVIGLLQIQSPPNHQSFVGWNDLQINLPHQQHLWSFRIKTIFVCINQYIHTHILTKNFFSFFFLSFIIANKSSRCHPKRLSTLVVKTKTISTIILSLKNFHVIVSVIFILHVSLSFHDSLKGEKLNNSTIFLNKSK